MSNADVDQWSLSRRMSRRRALSTGAKVGAAVVGTAVVAGGLGYLAGHSSAPSSTTTLTSTVLQSSSNSSSLSSTKLSTSASSSATSSSTSSSSSGSATSVNLSYSDYPNYYAEWPLNMQVPDPVSGLSGTVNVAMGSGITYQVDTTTAGTRAYAVREALVNQYPNVTWGGVSPTATYTAVFTTLQAGQTTYDVTRMPPGNPGIPDWVQLGYVEPVTDYFNSWTDKDQMPATDVATGSYNGDVYLIPDEGDQHAGWWRQDLVANAGYGTFNYTTGQYTGTTPNQMNYQEITQMTQKLTQQNSSRGLYATYWPNQTTAILGPWATDNFLKANGSLRYYGDSASCTVCWGDSPYYNPGLDFLNFLDGIIPYMTPGFQTLNVTQLVTMISQGEMAYMFGPDPNLDSAMMQLAANLSNPSAPAGVNVRQCIMPSVGWSDGVPLTPALHPTINFVVWFFALKGTSNIKADWEWIRAMASFNSELSLVGNGSGIPERNDAVAICQADPYADAAQWLAAFNGKTYTDVPISSSYGSALYNAYTDSVDAFLSGTGTPESCISTFVSTATTGLQKLNIPSAPSSDIV